jgi:hypothetical protein
LCLGLLRWCFLLLHLLRLFVRLLKSPHDAHAMKDSELTKDVASRRSSLDIRSYQVMSPNVCCTIHHIHITHTHTVGTLIFLILTAACSIQLPLEFQLGSVWCCD